MTLASDGTLSGTPDQQATFIPNITVTDSKGTAATAPIELDVIAPLAFGTSPALPSQNIALPVYMYIGATGGVQPYTFTLAPGSSMPPGLTFTNANAVGLIQGTPTTSGAYSFAVQVTDSFTPPFKISQTFSMNILNGVVVPNSTLPDAVQNVPYNEQIKVFGGTPPYHFALFPLASTPPGLTLDTSTGILSGTPTTNSPNADTMYMYVTDSAPTPATIQAYISVTVQPPLSFQTTSLPDSARGLNYGGSVYVVGGRAPYTVQVTSGALPDGLAITPSGNPVNVTGVPTKDGLFQFTVKVSDSYETPNTASQNLQIRISDPMVLSGPTQAQILYNQPYSTTFPVTGGFAPYTWHINTVPQGFAFDASTGTLSGTPNGLVGYGTTSVITVQDSSSPPLSANYLVFTLTVYGKLGILTSSLPAMSTNSTTWLGLASAGGAFPYQWSVSQGSLPPGMVFSNIGGNGTISGSPPMAGSYAFTVQISDGNAGSLHQTTSQQLTLVVKDPGQMTRNDTIATATPVSSISLLASISPYSDPSSTGPDVDYYSASAAPGTIVQVYVAPNNDFLQPPEPNSFRPVLEIVDSTGTRYQTCGYYGLLPGQVNNLPCINRLPGNQYLSNNYYAFQVPGSGSSPVTFFVRVLDERGDARPDFIYTLTIYGAN